MVVDAAGVLDAATVDRLNRIAFEVRARTGGEMAIVTLPDLKGRDVADVALRIGRAWGVGGAAAAGDRTRNAGVVVLLVPKETSSDGRGYIRIETGRGVEGFVTDATAGDIQRAAIPFFQRNDYAGGVVSIVSALADRYAAEFGVTLDTSLVPRAPAARPPGQVSIPPGIIIFLVIVGLMILSGLGRAARHGRGNGLLTLLWLLSQAQSGGRRHRGGWGGGGFGGGSFGGGGGFGGFGGGGGFSGGGSSGSW